MELFQSENNYFGVPVIKTSNSKDYQKALKKAFSLKEHVVIETFVDVGGYDGLLLQNNK